MSSKRADLQLFLGERRVVNVWLTCCPCHHRTTNTTCITSVLRDTTPQLGVEERAMTLKLPTIYDPKNGMSLKPLNSLLCYRVAGLKVSFFILGSEVASAYYWNHLPPGKFSCKNNRLKMYLLFKKINIAMVSFRGNLWHSTSSIEYINFLDVSFSRWRFEIFFIFIPTWGRFFSSWVLFFKWVGSTTNWFLFPLFISEDSVQHPQMPGIGRVAGLEGATLGCFFFPPVPQSFWWRIKPKVPHVPPFRNKGFMKNFRPYLKGKPTGPQDLLSGGGCATGVWLIRHNCWGFARCFFFLRGGTRKIGWTKPPL